MTSQERHEARYQRRKAARQAKHRARIAQYDNFDRVADVSSLVDANYNARKGVMWKASVARYNARYFKNEPIRQQREEWRDKINALETELATATQEFDAEMTKMAAARVKEG